MTSPPGSLRENEWRLAYPGMEYTFGTPVTPTWNLTTPDVGDVDLRVADVDRPRQDGRAFGTDYRSGRTITFELGIRGRSPEAAREEAALLTRAWRADVIRKSPGAVAELAVNYDGRLRVVYGRPRRFAPDFSDVAVNGFVTVTADFACIDDLFYGVYDDDVSFGIVPVQGGGLVAPLAAPLSTTRTSDRSQTVQVRSEMPVWPVVRVNGPIANPVVTIGEEISFEVRVELSYDEYVEIDTRPWARYAMRNGTANVSGAVRGTRLSKAALPEGHYEVGLRGMDPTGSSSVRLSWRPTYASL